MTTPARIVISGSMVFQPQMAMVCKKLSAAGVAAVKPELLDVDMLPTDEEYLAGKRSASRIHMDKIMAPETAAVFALNLSKYGVDDYIGPGTFAELAVAFALGKQLFVLSSLPQNYQDELAAWGAITTDGSLDPVISWFKDRHGSTSQ